MIDSEIEQAALERFKYKKVMTVNELSDLVGCSVPTIRKRLRKWKTFTSYNKNGSYYVLPSVPKFDENGLWKHRGVSFSRYGNLVRTVESLVDNSESGLHASQICEILGLCARSFVSHLQRIPGIRREKYEQKFVYFSVEKRIYHRQKSRREEAVVAKAQLMPLPPATEAIPILVDRIKHPNSSAEQTAQRLRRKGKRISVTMIRNLLSYHGVEKKTLDTSS